MRQRTLSPRFFSDEDLVELPPATRLLFAGLWCLADREGRLEDRPRRIRVDLHLEGVDVDAALAELEGCGKVRRYEVAGVRYIVVRGFAKHQRPHPKETASVLPGPAVESNGEPCNATASRVMQRRAEHFPSEPSSTSEPSEPSESHAPRARASRWLGRGEETCEVYAARCVELGLGTPPEDELGLISRKGRAAIGRGEVMPDVLTACRAAAVKNQAGLLDRLIGDAKRARLGVVTGERAGTEGPPAPRPPRVEERRREVDWAQQEAGLALVGDVFKRIPTDAAVSA